MGIRQIAPFTRIGGKVEQLNLRGSCRGLERFDKPTVRAITTRVEASGYGFQALVREVVRSLPFQSRRAEVDRTTVAAKSEPSPH
jgi:uncharacterized protein DUF1585